MNRVLPFILIILIAAAGFYVLLSSDEPATVPQTATTTPQDTSQLATASGAWLLASSSGYTYRYPADLPTQFIRETDWPPMLSLMDEAYVCEEGGAAGERAGITEERTVGTSRYCRTTVTEGAAGSIYSQYAYAFALGTSTGIFTFTTRAPQCANYDEPQLTACEQELGSFDLDALVDEIVATIEP